jgi:PIN domain nuclease of toxin-antitoxin system
MIYLDTHVVVWLFAGRLDLIPPLARALIEDNDAMISPIVGMELQYLYESARICEPATAIIDGLTRKIGLKRCDVPFAQVVDMALQEDWTRDPFDRVIVAQARLRAAPLLTKDRTIQDHYDDAAWDLDRS